MGFKKTGDVVKIGSPIKYDDLKGKKKDSKDDKLPKQDESKRYSK